MHVVCAGVYVYLGCVCDMYVWYVCGIYVCRCVNLCSALHVCMCVHTQRVAVV
jgi:hypothetical protein